jgi:hypothetical protein
MFQNEPATMHLPHWAKLQGQAEIILPLLEAIQALRV